MLRYYFICAHNAIVVVRPLFAHAHARLSVSKNMDDYIPAEGAVLRSFAAEVVVVARRQILRTATLSGRQPVPDPSLGVGGREPDSMADLLRHTLNRT